MSYSLAEEKNETLVNDTESDTLKVHMKGFQDLILMMFFEYEQVLTVQNPADLQQVFRERMQMMKEKNMPSGIFVFSQTKTAEDLKKSAHRSGPF